MGIVENTPHRILAIPIWQIYLSIQISKCTYDTFHPRFRTTNILWGMLLCKRSAVWYLTPEPETWHMAYIVDCRVMHNWHSTPMNRSRSTFTLLVWPELNEPLPDKKYRTWNGVGVSEYCISMDSYSINIFHAYVKRFTAISMKDIYY